MPHILVIDDDPTMRLILRRTLQQQGYTVSEAAQGQAGLALAHTIQPALIICDWMMPVMNGIDVCRAIKQDPGLRSTFFILLTARGAIDDRVLGLEAGADEFLQKPIDPSELKARVQAGLRLYQALQEQQDLNQELQRLNQALEAEKQRLIEERAEGAAYVRSILRQPIETPFPIGYQFQPSSQLGGDCFDYFWDEAQTKLVVYLLDVSGHGLKSAFASLQILKLLRSQTLLGVDSYDPAAVLTALNQLFRMEQNDQQYFTIWYGVYHETAEQGGQLVYASGGHPPALLVSNPDTQSVTITALKTPGMPIGLFQDATYQNRRCAIPQSSILYLYSDGIYEIPQADGLIWGLPAFIQLLEQAHRQQNASLDAIVQQTQQACLQGTFNDDLALLQIRFCPLSV